MQPKKPVKLFHRSPFCLNGIATAFSTKYGALFTGDCLKILPGLKDNSVDLVFADPPCVGRNRTLAEIDPALRIAMLASVDLTGAANDWRLAADILATERCQYFFRVGVEIVVEARID